MADSQLARLAKPFPDKLIHNNPSGGGSYVKHSVVKQKLIAVTGAYDWAIVQVIRGRVAAIAPNPQSTSKRGKEGRPELDDAVVGCVGRLTLHFDTGSRTCDGVGDCEEPHNWNHDGQRLKDAESDAIKRAASHFGAGLHLWAPGEFILYDQLAGRGDGES